MGCKKVYNEEVIQSIIARINEGMGVIAAVKACGINYGNSLDRRPEIVERLKKAKYDYQLSKMITPRSLGKMVEVIEKPVAVTTPKINGNRAVVRYVMQDMLFKMRNDGSYEETRDEYLSKMNIPKEQAEQLKKAADLIFDVLKRV